MTKIEVDNHKLMYHPERVTEYLEKGDCTPIYVEMGLTNACNHRCVFCALDYLERGREYINRDVMVSNLKDMASFGVKSVMFAGEGEPLLHRDVGLFVRTAKESGIDVSITTNGVAFSQTKIEQCLPYLSWIRFSIDSGSPENYAFIHGTNQRDFFKLMENIGDAVKLKNREGLKTIISAQFLMLSENMREAGKLAERLRDLGVDNLQIKPYSHHPSSHHNDFSVGLEEMIKLEDELRFFESPDFKILFRGNTIKRVFEGNVYEKCFGLPFFALVEANGNVIPCNLYYGNSEFAYGNLYENSFSEIWLGNRRKEAVKELDKKGVEGCRVGCRLDVINRYLERLKNPQMQDNFI